MKTYRLKTVIVQAGQSLVDLAIQEYAAVEGIFLLMMANQDKVDRITQDLTPGESLVIWPVKMVEDLVALEEGLMPYLPILMQWIVMLGGGGGGTGTGLNDGDYVHIRGDEVVDGIKSFLKTVKTNEILGFGPSDGVNVEGFHFNDGVIDLGTF